MTWIYITPWDVFIKINKKIFSHHICNFTRWFLNWTWSSSWYTWPSIALNLIYGRSFRHFGWKEWNANSPKLIHLRYGIKIPCKFVNVTLTFISIHLVWKALNSKLETLFTAPLNTHCGLHQIKIHLTAWTCKFYNLL